MGLVSNLRLRLDFECSDGLPHSGVEINKRDANFDANVLRESETVLILSFQVVRLKASGEITG